VAALHDKQVFDFLNDVQRSKQLILVVYGDAKTLTNLRFIKHPIITTPADSPGAASYTAQLIFGGVPATVKLVGRYSWQSRRRAGFTTSATRLKYTVPEDAGINVADIQTSVDTIVANAIQGKGAPGAVVMVVKDGKVIFNKAYGSHTYDGITPTKVSDIYDLASVTKVSAPTISMMRLYEQKKVHLDSTFGYYVPTARNTNKNSITLRNLLLHQSGIAAGVGLPVLPTDVSTVSSAAFPVKAANNVFLRKDYFKDLVWPRMLNVKIDTPKYVYSDLSMTYLKEVIETVTGNMLDEYVSKEFYQPLGMQSAGYNPLNRFDTTRIVPTELDAGFRKGMLQGYVHDPMAAKLGGVSGNAGLFASATDLAILYQMILNGGSYGGTKYFNRETVNLFTTKQSKISRRGLGFDRVDTTSRLGYPSKLASPQTYGHTGFTGTSFWVDPKHNLVFVFLSNRVHPTATNNLSRMRTQAKILDVVYEAINKANQSAIKRAVRR
jgi:CubicO group peptidase (beta-lactamase class C family)